MQLLFLGTKNNVYEQDGERESRKAPTCILWPNKQHQAWLQYSNYQTLGEDSRHFPLSDDLIGLSARDN